MSRFFSWLTIGVADAFLVVATAAFSPTAVKWLALSISIGTLVVSAGVAYGYRRHVATVLTAVIVAAVSAWTIVASPVFSHATVQNLALAGSLAIAGLAIVGLIADELSSKYAIVHSAQTTDGREPRLARAA
jgi:hypothetical protein